MWRATYNFKCDVSFSERRESSKTLHHDRVSVFSADFAQSGMANISPGGNKKKKGKWRDDEQFVPRGRGGEQIAFGQIFKTRQEKEKFISDKLLDRLKHLKAILGKMLPLSKPPYGEHAVGAFTIALGDADLKVCS